MLTGDNGILSQAQRAKSETENADAEAKNAETDAEAQNTEKDGAEEGEETDSASSEKPASDTEAGSGSVNSQAETGEGAQQTDSSQQTAATPSDYYIVKKGDSLVSISKAIYNTSNKVEEICQLNHIENMDMIYEGQKLLLP